MPHEICDPAGWSYNGDQDSELVDETRALMNNIDRLAGGLCGMSGY